MMMEMVRDVRPQFHDFLNLGEGARNVKRYRAGHRWLAFIKKKGCAALAGSPLIINPYLTGTGL
jgi:hypothetical protein